MAGAAVRPSARVPVPLSVLVGAGIVACAAGGVGAWWQLQVMDRQIEDAVGSVKRLAVTQGIPPTSDVVQYLTARRQRLGEEYAAWQDRVVVPAVVRAGDPQLHFQERVHDVQRTLERLATARALPVPELLGVPKELPPSDTVPRLLVQLQLIEETVTLLMERDRLVVRSVRIDDPEPMPSEEPGGLYLHRVPVRVQATAPIDTLMDVLQALGRQQPLVEVSALRVLAQDPGASGAAPSARTPLAIDVTVARYVAVGAPEAVAVAPR